MDIVTIQFDRNSNIPMYIQIANSIQNLIESGDLLEEEKLPSIRKLSKDLNVNNVTIVNAYKELENLGLVTAVKGSGYYVKNIDLEKNTNAYCNENICSIPNDELYEYEDVKLMNNGQIEISENSINFASAIPDPSIFPIEGFKKALNTVLDRDKGFAFGYQESNGYEPLRETLSNYLFKECSIKVDADNIQIVSGAQQGIDIIGKVLLNSGDYVITENPTYPGAVAVFKSRGANVIGVPMEKDGINLEILEEKLIKYKPKLIYLMTTYQSPTTISYSKEKMKKLLHLSKKYGVYILEDDSLSALSFSPLKNSITLKSLDTDDMVIYIKSFSKLLMPGLRIGFIISPENILTNIIKAKHTTDISSSGLIQRALQIYFENGEWQKHLNYMKKIYKSKYDVMLKELNNLKKYNIQFTEPKGGLNFWVDLPKNIDGNKLYLECAKKDVLIVPCNLFFLDNENNNSIRISYAATNIEEIKIGFQIIEQCINKILTKGNKKTYINPLM